MSAGNLATALHDELCEAFDCRYRMPDLDLGVPQVAQYGHQYPREFWEGMAESVVDAYTPSPQGSYIVDPDEPDRCPMCGGTDDLPHRHTYRFLDLPVVDGVATLPDGRTVRSTANVVRVPVLAVHPTPTRGRPLV